MDEPPSGLPPDAFAHPPQHLNPYARFHPSAHPPIHPHAHHHHQPPPPPPPPPSQQQQQQQRRQQVRDARQQGPSPYAGHLDTALQPLDPHDTFPAPFDQALSQLPYGESYALYPQPEPSTPVQHHPHVPRTRDLPSHPLPARDSQTKNTQLGILIPQSPIGNASYIPNDAVDRVREDQALEAGNAGVDDRGSATGPAPKQGGHFPGMKMIPDPPNLEGWRKVLFEVDRAIELTEEEFQTYFPHVDNVYSHRSTQRYKRQPFVSHYWDCRLKGRPPGTPKSDDPNKRKRKRQARERDLCDVKIKITEYFPNARATTGNHPPPHGPNGEMPGAEPMQIAGLVPPSRPFPGADGARYYQIQRVNGNGGNGKADGVAGPHKHSLDTSDSIKKNSIQRAFAKNQKERKKAEKTHHKKATGQAIVTVKRHMKDDPLKLHCSCTCPFSQRLWIALELKGLSYQYIETDQPAEINGFASSGLQNMVPLLQHEQWSCHDSAILLQYLEDAYPNQHPLMPADVRLKAHSRLWGDHIAKNLVPAYYRLLEAQDPVLQVERSRDLQATLQVLIDAADPTGPFFVGPQLSYVDVMLAPWIIRMRRVLKAFRGWRDPEEGSRWYQWIQGVESASSVQKTTSSEDVYREAFDRYLEHRNAPLGLSMTESYTEGKGLP